MSLNKLYLKKEQFYGKVSLILSLIFVLALPKVSNSQDLNSEEALKNAINKFIAKHSADYEKKYLNIRAREIGSLENEPYSYKDFFMLESKAEFENTLGYTTEREFYFLFYHYETELDRKYALKYWMKEFIEGKTIRPSRPVRTYEYATPTIILINPQSIVICNYECKYFEEDNYDYWKKTLLENFGNKEKTMVIEIECDGPLKWTNNAPDPKIRELF